MTSTSSKWCNNNNSKCAGEPNDRTKGNFAQSEMDLLEMNTVNPNDNGFHDDDDDDPLWPWLYVSSLTIIIISSDKMESCSFPSTHFHIKDRF